MVLSIFGVLLIGLGLFSGCVLVLVPFAVVPWTADMVLWILFPLLSLVGYGLFATGAPEPQVRVLSIAVSCLLLLLAAASAAGLVLEAASVVRPETSTRSLWYVLVVAGVLGTLGAASFRRASPAA